MPDTIDTVTVDGLALANELREQMKQAVAAHVAAGRRAPQLAVVLVGDDPASASYIKGKQRACKPHRHGTRPSGCCRPTRASSRCSTWSRP